ncbi:MAG: hypothetical protein FWF10_07780 [Clostridiales bacterium]|nr:hypothetical protein [Clostridiales bacterium]
MKTKKIAATVLALVMSLSFAVSAFADSASFSSKTIKGGPSQRIAAGLEVTKTQVSVTVSSLTFNKITNGAKSVSFRAYFGTNACTGLITFTGTGIKTSGYTVSVPMGAPLNIKASIPSTEPTDYATFSGSISN